jgi:hypothetical protein
MRLTTSVLVLGTAFFGAVEAPRAAQAPSNGLRILVVAGEDAVNVVQQPSAVLPVVEVRDRNDQPVAGAIVNFAIRSGRATFGGAPTLTVTTNAAGRAGAAGLTPTGSGARQISASAAFQGQTATVAITQTNVLTAAQAAAVSTAGNAGGAGSASTAAGGGAGAGGGVSATTIGIVGGAAAGGALAATRLVGGFDYRGSFGGTLFMPFSGCTRTEVLTGTLEMNVSDTNGAVSGHARIDGRLDVTAFCGFSGPGGEGTSDGFRAEIPAVTGTTGAITFAFERSNQFDNASGSGVNAYAYAFTGALSGDEIAGTLTITRTLTPTNEAPVSGSVVQAVTLRRP